METLGQGKCVVLVIGEKYLKSRYCMFELIRIFEAGDFRRRIFPVILKDSKIYNVEDQLDYAIYWEEKIDNLDQKRKKLRGNHLANSQRELDLYTTIRNTFDTIIDSLSDMNCLKINIHQEEGFRSLIQKVKETLAEPDSSTV